jgi:hypothetical protein
MAANVLKEGYDMFIIRSRSALIAAHFALNIFIKLTSIWLKTFLQITETHLVTKEVSVTAAMNESICMQTKTIFPGHNLTVILQ